MFSVVDFFNWQPIYIAGSILVALAIWLQNMILKKHNGKLPDNSAFYVLSLLDSLWVIISCVAVYFLSFNNIIVSIPVVYMLYTLSSWVYAMRTTNDGDLPTNPDELIFAHNYLSFCQSFALAFFVLCVVVVFFVYFDGYRYLANFL